LNTAINHQGQLVDPQTLVATAFNRSLRYGDGIFETMYWDGQWVCNLPFHLDRLFRGLTVLRFDLSAGFTRDFISGEIFRLCQNNTKDCKARVRLNVFREDGGTLMPESNKPVFVIESSLLNEKDQSPLRLTIFEREMKSIGVLSNMKTNNYLLNILAVQHAREAGFNDALILNSNGNICEASSSNVFFVRKGTLVTPALTEGCVAGTKRRQLMEVLPRMGFRVEEEVITLEMVFSMEEIFLTNAIRGIIPVAYINQLELSSELTNRLVQLLSASNI
jgi:branched-chain amino acid aminotransferase